jgi:hypothetical protein
MDSGLSEAKDAGGDPSLGSRLCSELKALDCGQMLAEDKLCSVKTADTKTLFSASHPDSSSPLNTNMLLMAPAAAVGTRKFPRRIHGQGSASGEEKVNTTSLLVGAALQKIELAQNFAHPVDTKPSESVSISEGGNLSNGTLLVGAALQMTPPSQ